MDTNWAYLEYLTYIINIWLLRLDNMIIITDLQIWI